MSNLKECPFCGGEATLTNKLSKDEYGQRLWNVCCFGCANRTSSYWDKEIAIEAWNTRKPLERVIERLETEGKLADEERDRCARENPLQFDTAKGYATGIYNAIEIIKEELM